MTAPTWQDLPLTHPNIFRAVVVHSLPGDVLRFRSVCQTWLSWFNSTSSVWSRLLANMLSSTETFTDSFSSGPLTWYRMRKMLELSADIETEQDCMISCMKIQRALRETVSIRISDECMNRVMKLEETIPVIGPPALFIRLKVDHPVIKKIIGEMLCRFLTVIILDKQDAIKDFVKMMVLRSMYGSDGAQNWVYVDNLRPKVKKEIEDDDAPEGLVLEGEHRLEEALRMSMQSSSSSSRGEKRKHEDDDDESSGDNKKVKTDRDHDTATSDNNEESEDDESNEQESSQDTGPAPGSLYAVEDVSNMFPTFLDLLSIDNEIVKSVLIDRCNIDKLMIIPQFNKFLKYLPTLQSTESKIIVGTDEMNKVVSVDLNSFSGDGDLVMGNIEQPQNVYNHPERLLEFWCNRDIRHRWPEFARHLEELDKNQNKEPKPSSSQNFNPMVIGAKDESDKKKNESVNDIMASLNARGISIQKK